MNQTAEKEEYEAKQKELEAVINPIMSKIYPEKQRDTSENFEQKPTPSPAGPKIEEVD